MKKKVALDVSGVVSFRRSGENVSDCVLDDTVKESTPVKAKRQKKE